MFGSVNQQINSKHSTIVASESVYVWSAVEREIGTMGYGGSFDLIKLKKFRLPHPIS